MKLITYKYQCFCAGKKANVLCMCVVCVYMNMLNMVTKIAGYCRAIEKNEENMKFLLIYIIYHSPQLMKLNVHIAQVLHFQQNS